jgi:hypothetical protein
MDGTSTHQRREGEAFITVNFYKEFFKFEDRGVFA